MATEVTGSAELVKGYGFTFASILGYTTSSTDTTYSITAYSKVKLASATGTVKMSVTSTLIGTGQSTRTKTATFDNTTISGNNGSITYLASKKWTWNKKITSQSVTITAKADNSKMSASSASKLFTIPALAHKTISYNSNGGSGSIAPQTKYVGTSITLSNGSSFSRSGYALKCWNTKADGTGTNYQLGATYSTQPSADVTLYAIWDTTYQITNLKAYRVDSNGNPLQRGENISISFDYDTLSTSGVAYTVIIDNESVEENTTTNTMGTFTGIFFGYGIDSSHTIEITLGNVAISCVVNEVVPAISCMGDEEGVYVGIQARPRQGQSLTLPLDVYIDDHLSPIGDIRYGALTTTKNIATETWTNLCSVALTPGIWILIGGARFPSNATGHRRMNITKASAGTDNQLILPAVSGAQTQLVMTRVVKITEDTTMHLNAYQNSGSTLTMPATGTNYGSYITAIRIL